MNQPLCDAGMETLVMNGFGAKCMMTNKDVRRMTVDARPDGALPDMENRADLAIFEVSVYAVD